MTRVSGPDDDGCARGVVILRTSPWCAEDEGVARNRVLAPKVLSY